MKRFLLLTATTIIFFNFLNAQFNSIKIFVTSEAGDVMSEKENIEFKKQTALANSILIDIKNKRQSIDGIGSSLTESSAFVLAHLQPAKRKEILTELFGEKGANFAISRTHIGSSDFCVEGKYSYAEVSGDTLLKHFSLSRDKEGFSKQKYLGIIDSAYDLLPLIKEVTSIKNAQKDNEFRIVASPWSAPAWMKDNNAYYEWTNGGKLLEKYYGTFADYFVKYFEAYKKEGITFWGITPMNEPEGNYGSWESTHFSPETQALFIGKYLGPTLHKNGYNNIKIFGFDQNRKGMDKWVNGLLGDPEAAKYMTGIAVHWYASTFNVFEDEFNQTHNKYPNYSILHTEGCIDNLGVKASNDVSDKEGWQEKGWFKNDAWWWNPNATDWGYTRFEPELHPKYTPVHRYARDIIVGINNWMTGFIDWNVVLDKNGGPNHVGNYCGAPVMIDTQTGETHFTPIYSVLKQLSKTIRPGDIALKASEPQGDLKDSLYVGSVLNKNNQIIVSVLNVTKKQIQFSLQLGDYSALVNAPANALETIVVELPK